MDNHISKDERKQSTDKAHKRGCMFYLKRGLLALIVIIVALPITGMIFQVVATESDRQAYPAPGEMIDVGGYKLHIYCTGEGSPTVILDAGGGFSSSSWGWIQPEIAQTTRVCAYDRAGWGWSEPSLVGYDALQNARELHSLLVNAHIPAPYVLVGHSLGGLYDRVYAQQYPDEIAGLVQVDASHPDVWQQMGMREGANVDPQLLAMGPMAARFGLLRLMDFANDSDLSGQLPDYQEHAMRASLVTVQFAEVAQQFDAAMPEILAQARSITSLNDMPLIVVTIGERDDVTPEQKQILQTLQHALASLSSNSVYIEVDNATHVSLVHNRDHAQLTIDAIKMMVAALRSGQKLAQ